MDATFATLFSGTDEKLVADHKDVQFCPDKLLFTKKHVEPGNDLEGELMKRNLSLPGSEINKSQLSYSSKLLNTDNRDIYVKTVTYVSEIGISCNGMELFNTFVTSDQFPVIIYDSNIKIYCNRNAHNNVWSYEKTIKDTFGKKWIDVADEDCVIIYTKNVSYMILISKCILITNLKQCSMQDAWEMNVFENNTLQEKIQHDIVTSEFHVIRSIIDSIRVSLHIPVIMERELFVKYVYMFKKKNEQKTSKLIDLSIIDMTANELKEYLQEMKTIEESLPTESALKQKISCEYQRMSSYKKNRRRMRKSTTLYLRNFPYVSEYLDARQHNTIRVEKGEQQYINSSFLTITLKHSAEYLYHVIAFIEGLLYDYQHINENSLLKCEVRSAGKWERLLRIYPRMKGTTHCQKGFVPTVVSQEEIDANYISGVNPESLKSVGYKNCGAFTYAAPIPEYDLQGTIYEGQRMFIICPFDNDNLLKHAWYPGWNNLGEPCGFKEDQRKKEKWRFKYYILPEKVNVKLYPYKFDQLIVPYMRYGKLSPIVDRKLNDFAGEEDAEFRRVGIITPQGHYNTLLHSILYCTSDTFIHACKKTRDTLVTEFRSLILSEVQKLDEAENENMKKYIFSGENGAIKKDTAEQILRNPRRELSHTLFQDILAETINCNILIISYARDKKKNRKYTRTELMKCDMLMDYGKINPILCSRRNWIIIFADNDRGVCMYEPLVKVLKYDNFLSSKRQFGPEDIFSLSVSKMLLQEHNDTHSTDNYYALLSLIEEYNEKSILQIVTEVGNVIAYYVPGKKLFPLLGIERIYPRIGVLQYETYIRECLASIHIADCIVSGKETIFITDKEHKIRAVGLCDSQIRVPIQVTIDYDFISGTRIISDPKIKDILTIDEMVATEIPCEKLDNIHINAVRKNIFIRELFHRFHMLLYDSIDETSRMAMVHMNSKEILHQLHTIFRQNICIVPELPYDELNYRKLLIRTSKETAFYTDSKKLKVTEEVYHQFCRKFVANIQCDKGFIHCRPDIYVYKDFLCHLENEKIFETFGNYCKYLDGQTVDTSEANEGQKLALFKDYAPTQEYVNDCKLSNIYLRSQICIYNRIIQPCKSDEISMFRALSNCIRKLNIPPKKQKERSQAYMQWNTVVHDIDAFRILQDIYEYLFNTKNVHIRSIVNTMNLDGLGYNRVLMKLKKKINDAICLEKQSDYRGLISIPSTQFIKRIFHDSVILQLIANARNVSIHVYDQNSFPLWDKKTIFNCINGSGKQVAGKQVLEIFHMIKGEYHSVF